MYAIIRSGGKQYTVRPGDEILVERLAAEVGSELSIDEVLFVGGEGDPRVGRPFVDGAKVTASVLSHGRRRKILVYKFKRRKKYRRIKGHRQSYTQLRIKDVAA